MHEIGVLYEVVKSVEKVALENHADKISFIALDVGQLSGMLPYFFEQYFPIVIEKNPMFEGAKLRITETVGVGSCKFCGELYDVREHEGECPKCKSRDKEILNGTELVIKEIGVA